MWVRGLKPLNRAAPPSAALSHPMWVRGLKQNRLGVLYHLEQVAPYVGAWIET